MHELIQCLTSLALPASKFENMRLGRTEIRGIVLLNYSIVAALCTYIIIRSSLNIASTLYPLLHHLPRQQTTTGCNGRAEYCDRKYDNMTQIGTHGSAFSGIMPSDNQNFDITAQLDAGIRFLQAQTHRGLVFGELKLCHTSCMMEDGGALKDYLTTVKKWLEANPHEVVTLLLTNGDYLDVGAFDQVFTKAGITDLVYTPQRAPPKTRHRRGENNATSTNPEQWPTLGQMIAKNQRLVVFLDYGAKPTSVPYILNEFAYFWETPYDTTDPTFSQCAIDRPYLAADATPAARRDVEQRMYIVNHYLDTKVLGMEVPDRRDAKKTNAWESVGRQAGLCERVHGRKPRVVLVDYFDVGGWFRVQDRLNGFG